MSNRHPHRLRTGLIGGAVGLATAGVIVLIATKKDAEPEEDRGGFDRPAFKPEISNTLGGEPTAVGIAGTPGQAATTPSAADQGRAEAEAKAKAEAEAKAKAEAQAKADAKAMAEARKVGILGSTALKQGGAFASLTGTGDISSGFDDKNIYGGLLGNEAGEMNGGFGFGKSGFGPGGGGTGWGTIGTIGRGSTGSGYGVGGLRSRGSAVPTISIGQPSVVPTVASAADPGNLDKAIIRRYIKRNAQKLQYCYEKELLAKSKLAGTVSTQFTITESGVVGGASASGVDPNVSSCVAGVVKGIEFPKPKGTGGVTVSYPFTFRPAGS